jgi:hypothetical protein
MAQLSLSSSTFRLCSEPQLRGMPLQHAQHTTRHTLALPLARYNPHIHTHTCVHVPKSVAATAGLSAW